MENKRKGRVKKMKLVRWGSKSLTEFLQSIGKDTSKQLSQYDVASIIKEYVCTFKLINPAERNIVCDKKLRVLFGKASVPQNIIYDLLSSHFSEKDDASDDDHLDNSEENEDVSMTCQKQVVSSSEKRAPYQKKIASRTLLSNSVAIIPENIKLLYLKWSVVVEELVKDPDSFEGKILGSYVRIPSDPNDLSEKSSHQLHPITGVIKPRGNGCVHEKILLQVSNTDYIPVSMLSDKDFTKKECEDLRQRFNDGLLKRPTIAEVKEKARLLREDITKYSTEIKFLSEVPKVIAENLVPETTLKEHIRYIKSFSSSPISIHENVMPSYGSDASGNITTEHTVTTEDDTSSDDDFVPSTRTTHRKKTIRQNGNIRKPIGNVGSKRKRDILEASDKRKKETVIKNSKSDAKNARKSIKQKKAHIQHKVPTLRTRSSPQPLYNIIKTLNDAQKEAVIQIGFGGILDLSFEEIPSKIAYWVVDNFDEKTCKLQMQNTSLTITKEAIHKMLGIPIGGLPIKAKSVCPKDKVIQEWSTEFGKEARKILPSDVVKKIKHIDDAGRMFKLHFLVIFATTMADRPRNGSCNLNILPSMENDEVINNLDWCGYIMDCLKTSKGGWNKENRNSLYVGPLALLTLFYVDSTMSQIMQVSRKRPAIKGWTMDLLREREEADIKSGGFGKGAIEPPLEVEEFEDDGTNGPEGDITPKNGEKDFDDFETSQTRDTHYNGWREECQGGLHFEEDAMNEDGNIVSEVNDLQGHIGDIASMIKRVKDTKMELDEALSHAFGRFPDSVDLQNLKSQVEDLFTQSTGEHQETIIITDSEDETDPFYKYVYGSKR